MSTKRIALMGTMLGLIVVLTTLESLIFAPIPLLPPHVKPGLANVVVMYCVFFIGRTQAVSLNALKALFVFVLRGPMAGILSFSGGMLSVLIVIALVSLIKNEKISYTAISIAGATTHNIAQFAVAMSIMAMPMPYSLFYMPILLFTGVFMGILTGITLRAAMPAIERSMKYFKK